METRFSESSHLSSGSGSHFPRIALPREHISDQQLQLDVGVETAKFRDFRQNSINFGTTTSRNTSTATTTWVERLDDKVNSIRINADRNSAMVRWIANLVLEN